MYPPPPVPRIRGHYDGPRNFGPRPNMYVRHSMRGFGGRHMDGPRPRYHRDHPHGFVPPVHNFDSMGGRHGGPVMNRDSPSVSDLVHHTASSCDGTLLVSCTTATVLQSLCRTTCVSRLPQLTTQGFCGSKVLLPACSACDSLVNFSAVYVCMWLIHIICFCLPFLFVFFLLPFFMCLAFSSISYLPEYGPAPFPGRRS